MTYQEGISHLEVELELLDGDQHDALYSCLESIANGTQTEKEGSSEVLADMYQLVEWLNSEMAFEAIQAIYMTVNPNLPPRPTK